MKLFSVHFAGGNKYSLNMVFNHLTEYFPVEINRNNFDLPINIEEIVNYLKLYIFKSDYIFYGHSMGALIAYLVCQKLQEENLPMPQKLIVSGKKAPSIPREKKLAHLPNDEFWNEILKLGGIPDEMQNYPELIDYYLPILRHDFKLVESYQYEKKPKLNIPIDVFYGSEEAVAEEITGWQNESTEKVTITKLEGNHFFIFNHVEYFRNYFDNLVNQK